MAKVKIFVTDRLSGKQTDRLTDGRMRFNVTALSRKAGTKISLNNVEDMLVDWLIGTFVWIVKIVLKIKKNYRISFCQHSARVDSVYFRCIWIFTFGFTRRTDPMTLQHSDVSVRWQIDKRNRWKFNQSHLSFKKWSNLIIVLYYWCWRNYGTLAVIGVLRIVLHF